jgi:hypothetical protein
LTTTGRFVAWPMAAKDRKTQIMHNIDNCFDRIFNSPILIAKYCFI